MSRAVIAPLQVGATAPEALSVLQQRLQAAEDQAEALIKDVGSLGVPREQLLAPSEPPPRPPLSPLQARAAFGGGGAMLWRSYEDLVSRVCRMESLLQTLKLTVFRLETDRQLNPAHSAHLAEQLAALQQEQAEERRAARRELVRVREQLRQARQDREATLEEARRLGDALEVATATKMDVALAAEELKEIKAQMSERLLELKEELSREVSLRTAMEESHGALLQRVQGMEKVVEVERAQVEVLQQDCRALQTDVQEARQQLEKEAGRAQELEGQCQSLRDQAAAKELLVTEMTEDLKSTRLALQKQQEENSHLQQERSSLRSAANRVQSLNEQLECQCAELGAALRSLTVENARLITEHQASLQVEKERMAQKLQEQDLLLDAARRNIQGELQAALSDRLRLQKELEALRAEHAKLQQSSTVAQETAVTQKELLDCTVERLRGELGTTIQERDAARKERNSVQTELQSAMRRLEEEKASLETELTETKLEVGSLSSALQKQEEENQSLMGRLVAMEHQQHAQQQVEQMLAELTDSKNKLAYDKGKLQARVEQLQEELLAVGNAKADCAHQRKLCTALENKYSQVTNELNSLKISYQRLEAQLTQAHAALERKESDFALAISVRDEALQDAQALRGQLEELEEQHRNRVGLLERQLGACRQDGGRVAETLENMLASHARLQQSAETLQTELGSRDAELTALRAERVQGQQELQWLQEEVERLQGRLATAKAQQHGTKVEPLCKALEVARGDNKKLAQSLEQALQVKSTLQDKLSRALEQLKSTETQHQDLLTKREEELRQCREEVCRLTDSVDSLKQQLKKEREAGRRAGQKDAAELKKALEEASSWSADLSLANRELREKVNELEKVVANQKAKIKGQRAQLKKHMESQANSTQRVKEMESELRELQSMKEEYQKKNYEQGQLVQQFWTETASLQQELQCLSSGQQEAVRLGEELEREQELRQKLEDRCERLEQRVRQLKQARETAEQRLKDASLESQQISDNLEEAHCWFQSKFESLQRELDRGESLSSDQCSQGRTKKSVPTPCRQTTKVHTNTRSMGKPGVRSADSV
ncbi:coiled-coil domain-containing protein 150 isoform X1 [Lepisosteus oculatus]|uniref:coiled-coil domain-containing protein 150 isoform X1 n=1 Tax=Lepisosteus oculatus TaxID=7918 RepID=UPI0035F51C06